MERHALGRAYETRKGVYAISINGVFSCADIAEVGPTVLVTCGRDRADHRLMGDTLADDIWTRRSEVLNSYMTSTEAAEVARDWDGNAGPMVVAVYADNPGEGAYGDATALPSTLLADGIKNACFGPLIDPKAAAFLNM